MPFGTTVEFISYKRTLTYAKKLYMSLALFKTDRAKELPG